MGKDTARPGTSPQPLHPEADQPGSGPLDGPARGAGAGPAAQPGRARLTAGSRRADVVGSEPISSARQAADAELVEQVQRLGVAGAAAAAGSRPDGRSETPRR